MAARSAGLDQDDLISEPPSELNGHIARLQASESAAAYFREGWRVQVVDLARVCAIQPSIFTDSAAERVMDVKHVDLAGITQVPVFTRTMETIEEVAPPGMLPQDAYLGERPALLRDYRDDTVARDVRLPAVQRMIVIQGNGLNAGG